MTTPDKILNKLKTCIKESKYIMTLHAEEEMNNDNLSIFDIEHAILTGEILEKQKDNDRNEWKYLVHGKTINDDFITVVVKISPTSKMLIITVFRDN